MTAKDVSGKKNASGYTGPVAIRAVAETNSIMVRSLRVLLAASAGGEGVVIVTERVLIADERATSAIEENADRLPMKREARLQRSRRKFRNLLVCILEVRKGRSRRTEAR